MNSLRDMVIIGAGLAGSSLAAALAARGWDVLLLEQDYLPRHKVCGEFLSPEAQASLQTLGLYQVVRALEPAQMSQAALTSRLGLTVGMDLPGDAWGISRYALDAALAGAAEQAGAKLRSGVTATAIRPAGEIFRVSLSAGNDKREISARAVVACCGRHSRPGLPPRPAANPARSCVGVKCHYEAIVMPGRVELYLFPGGYAGISPVEGGRFNVCLLATQAAFSRGGKQVQSMLSAAAVWNPVLGRRLAGGRPVPGTEAAVAPVDTYRPAAPWDGVACLGDTAVMMPPLSGDGMAMALRSAELCAPLAHDFLAGRLSLGEWEAGYRRAWQQAFYRPVKVSRALQSTLAIPALSEALVGLGRLAPPLANLLVRATRGETQARGEMKESVFSA